MANRMFSIRATDTINEAGGVAYSFSPEHALAQVAVTGCLYPTYYASAEAQLAEVIKISHQCELSYVAKTAVYAREKGYMKDMPALLCVAIASRAGKASQESRQLRDSLAAAREQGLPQKTCQELYDKLAHADVVSAQYHDILHRIFPRVIDSGKMLRNFIQILRSGVTGRKSLGSSPKRLIAQWFAARNAETIFRQSVGSKPSLADVLCLSHPKPDSEEKNALFGWLLNRPYEADNLPNIVKEFEAWKINGAAAVPNVPFEMLTALPLTTDQWKAITRQASWTWTRMNLNTMARHKVFADDEMVEIVSKRLADPELVYKSRCFPYQLLAAYLNIDSNVPGKVRDALSAAVEFSTENVQTFNSQTYVLVDVSGSMGSPVTGYRKGATSAVRCVDVAALIASVILRRNPNSTVIPFDTGVRNVHISSQSSVLQNAARLAINGGGTDCSAPLRHLNAKNAIGEVVIFVSDNESWVNQGYRRGTGVMNEWTQWKARNPSAKLICIDLTPSPTAQAYERDDILNIGGFSDNCFDVIHRFVYGELNPSHWVGDIKAIEL